MEGVAWRAGLRTGDFLIEVTRASLVAACVYSQLSFKGAGHVVCVAHAFFFFYKMNDCLLHLDKEVVELGISLWR